jgi:hypothetical protein
VERLDQLFRVLRTGGLFSGEDIQRKLGISQPVMSRLIRTAGSRVSRFGRSVATLYALPREVGRLGHKVPVFRVNEQGMPSRHGVLHFLAGGGCWFERENRGGQSFPGLPPFVEDMGPQGYIGRNFPAIHPDLKLPASISDWNDDHQVIALSMRGEDCVGNLIIGEESLDRFIARELWSCDRADYPELAAGALSGQPGSSAGGEHPKFAAYSKDRHALVKFAGGEGAMADRWRDLLVCEHIALESLRSAGIPVPHSEWFDLGGTRYLEVDRFDRIGKQGRRGVISLWAINHHYLGDYPDHWSTASNRILEEPSLNLSAEDADRMIWLDTFGDLIGNTDRHFGNLSFFAEEGREPKLTLAPVYDMLPMILAPAALQLVERPFTPRPPTALNLHLWHEVANHALEYWSALGKAKGLSAGFRAVSLEHRDKVARVMDNHS